MAATELDVLDTAVKIGLGAAIAGISSYLVARVDRRKVLDKETLDRQVQIVREVATKVDDFHSTMLDYLCSCPVKLDGDQCPVGDPTILGRLRIQAELSSDELAKGQTKRQTARASAANLQAARSLLSLLGFPEPVAALNKYKQAAEQFWLAIGDVGKPMDAVTFAKLKSELGWAPSVAG